MKYVNTENEIVKKLEPLIEQHYDELYALLCCSPKYSYFWDYFHIAFYKVALRKVEHKSVSGFARYLRMGRTTAIEMFKKYGFYEAKMTPTYCQLSANSKWRKWDHESPLGPK